MCESMNNAVQAANNGTDDPSLSFNCTVSEDCLTVQCIVRVLIVPYIVKTTFNPCDTPYSFRLQAYQQNAEPLVNEVISESKVVTFAESGLTGRIDVTVIQGCSAITYSVSHN